MFELQKEQLAQLIPGNKEVDAWYEALVAVMPKYGINTERRAAHFISQCAHESNNFRSLQENLNYSEKALKAVFGRYFGDAPKANAAEYARNPEKIANRVYFDKYRKYKMGNTNEGDGWLFRGRGLKQLTGRENYTKFGASVNMTAEEAAEYVATPAGAVESACWFWDTKKLNNIADTDNVTKMTKVINGGNIGLADRQQRYAKAMEVFGNPVSIVEDDGDDNFDIDEIGVLRKGSRGEGVKMMQEALGVGADGAFGPGTERALKAWQTANGLTADGIAGPATLGVLLGD
jgi:putative chitinase|tara:strand:+ start:6476 stop:7345 length:870 start_codon:yes stop_codon:yes gene_type:complete